MKHEKSRSEEMKGFKTEEMHGDVLRWSEFRIRKSRRRLKKSRWSKFKIQSVYGDPKKPKERRASKEPYLMTKTARRSYSKAEHHHYTSRRNIS